jgi:hypothetical protein
MSYEDSIVYKKEGRGTPGSSDRRDIPEDYVTITYPFDKYLIVVKLTSDGRFIGIEEIRINKDFRSYKQAPQEIFHYIDEYEPE